MEFQKVKTSLLLSVDSFCGHPLSGSPNFMKVLKCLDRFPHIFVLACLMDRGIPAERAWSIPFEFCDRFCGGDLSIQKLLSFNKEDIQHHFDNLHRYENKMADVFYEGIKKIQTDYCGDASLIWSGNLSSALIVARFLEFKGCGVKIATMAANILHRVLNVPMSDTAAIDISPNVHVCRIFKRLGLVSDVTNRDAVIYMARAICPEYPGKIDFMCWKIGQDYCRPQEKDTNCNQCPLSAGCPKLF